MSINTNILRQVETLRIPLDNPISSLDWKDWYHFLLLDHRTGTRVLVNLNLMGRPGQGELQVSLIVNLPRRSQGEVPGDVAQGDTQASPASLETFGTAFAVEWQPGMVQREPLRLRAQGIGLAIQGVNSGVAVQDQQAQLAIQFRGTAIATPIMVTEGSPFGSGFIGWGVVPGLRLTGELRVGDRLIPIDPSWFCYHDRNFGRFRWGEDIGWEWFVAHLICENGRRLTLVFDRRTNKDHLQAGIPYLVVYVDEVMVKTFMGPRLRINWQWSPTLSQPARLPGNLASVFTHRAVNQPQGLQIQAVDPKAQISVQIDFEAMMELVVPDNQARQYTFIEEVTGQAAASLVWQGQTLRATGLVYAEYVQ